MTILLTLVQIVVCIFLILVVLLQTGKGGDLATTFGGGSSQTVFGARGAATILNKLTVVAAVFFILNSLALAVISTKSGSAKSVMESVEEVRKEGDVKPVEKEQPKATESTETAKEGEVKSEEATQATEASTHSDTPPAEEGTAPVPE